MTQHASSDLPREATDAPTPADPAQLHVTGSGAPLIFVPVLDGTGLLFYR